MVKRDKAFKAIIKVLFWIKVARDCALEDANVRKRVLSKVGWLSPAVNFEVTFSEALALDDKFVCVRA